MKKLFYFLVLGFAFLACSQEKKVEPKKQEISYDINKYIFPEAKDVTAENFENKLISNVIHYDNEPVYYFRVHKENCLIEIYTNDVVEHIDYEDYMKNRVMKSANHMAEYLRKKGEINIYKKVI